MMIGNFIAPHDSVNVFCVHKEFYIDSIMPTKLRITALGLFFVNIIAIDYEQTDTSKFEFLPRIGFKLKLDKSFDKLKYKAYGDDETYADMYEYAFKDEYESDVYSQYRRYVKPQESGSHYLPDYAEVTDGKNTVKITGMTSFSCLPYSAEQIENAKHDYELPILTGTYLCADYFVSGLGTNACGPLPDEKYRTPSKASGVIRFEFNSAE